MGKIIHDTLFETENERQKTKAVPIPLPRAFRNFPDVKTRNDFFFYNWTSEIIPFIHFGKQMDRTEQRLLQKKMTIIDWDTLLCAFIFQNYLMPLCLVPFKLTLLSEDYFILTRQLLGVVL